MSVENKITEIFGSFLGDQEDLKAKVASYIHDKVPTYEGASTVAALPTSPVPWGIYKIITTGGTVNGGALTLAVNDLAMYDDHAGAYVKLGITRAD